ncbi:uncharacterized protein C2845_PM07G04690 [Panicum miliaceum]|uniref:Uncharacterized protein n=1 Tax=Panicum miliaceum TaxID=4540 RepID=A0A3L6SSN4_PANMI|nr:uncharacterized protein C2845_PM07G04690 [Panicum miliaceum]
MAPLKASLQLLAPPPPTSKSWLRPWAGGHGGRHRLPQYCLEMDYVTCPSSGAEKLPARCNCCLTPKGCTLHLSSLGELEFFLWGAPVESVEPQNVASPARAPAPPPEEPSQTGPNSDHLYLPPQFWLMAEG